MSTGRPVTFHTSNTGSHKTQSAQFAQYLNSPVVRLMILAMQATIRIVRLRTWGAIRCSLSNSSQQSAHSKCDLRPGQYGTFATSGHELTWLYHIPQCLCYITHDVLTLTLHNSRAHSGMQRLVVVAFKGHLSICAENPAMCKCTYLNIICRINIHPILRLEPVP